MSAEQQLSKRDRKNLETLASALEAMGEVHPFTLRTALTFLRLAAAEGSTQSEIARRYDLPRSTVNRMIKLMGAKGVREQNGLGLLDLKAEDADERVKPVRLSPKGSELVAAIGQAFRGIDEDGAS